MKKFTSNNLGMTLAEVSLGMMVIVIFMSVFSLVAKYYQKYIKLNFGLDNNQKSILQNESTILKSMDKWSQILAQPSYSKKYINSISCSYPPNDGSNLWDLPGQREEGLPTGYKYCIFSTSLAESDLSDLIKEEKNAQPGIYFLYAIPDSISTNAKPIRRIMCRPITFC